MNELVYSVIIRTTGNAGEKYRKLLDSISKLEPAPFEIIVVLPKGYQLPEAQLGRERFVFSPKGMVIQRLTGIDACETPYALICDDDVSFGSDFVRRLFEPIKKGHARISAAPLYAFLPSGVHAIVDCVMARAVPTVFHKERYVSVLKSTGYSYNRRLNSDSACYYESQSLPWTCFFAETEAIREIDLEDEIWLDLHGYSAMDDQTMFYKAWLRGIKTVVVSDVTYEHLDAKTSIRNNKDAVEYALVFNRFVFWYRYIYRQQKSLIRKMCAIICYSYYMIWTVVFWIYGLIRKRSTLIDFKNKVAALIDAVGYVRSDEYRQLPNILY